MGRIHGASRWRGRDPWPSKTEQVQQTREPAQEQQTQKQKPKPQERAFERSTVRVARATVEVLRTPFVDRVVDAPGDQQGLAAKRVQKTDEIPQVPVSNEVVDTSVVVKREARGPDSAEDSGIAAEPTRSPSSSKAAHFLFVSSACTKWLLHPRC